MSLFGDLAGKALGALAGNQHNSMVDGVLGMIVGQQFGGIKGLAAQFAAKGLGHIMDSWVGTGKNLPITKDQVMQVLGSDVVKGLAAKVGLNADQVAGHLTEILPQVVDRLTPQGQVTSNQDLASKGMDLLKGFLK